MGCTSSKSTQCAYHSGIVIDDSIHAMIERERRHAKAHGNSALTYRPRAPHPLLQGADSITAREDDTPTIAISDDNSEHSTSIAEDSSENLERLLRHSRYHCDTVDALDLPRGCHRVTAGVVR